MVYEEVHESVIFWDNIKNGEEIEGIMLHKESGQYGNQYVIACKDGEQRRTPCHKNLQDKLDQLKLNDMVRITYKGNKPTNLGNPIELYKVEVDKPKVDK